VDGDQPQVESAMRASGSNSYVWFCFDRLGNGGKALIGLQTIRVLIRIRHHDHFIGAGVTY
jgi:hypothetical protein